MVSAFTERFSRRDRSTNSFSSALNNCDNSIQAMGTISPLGCTGEDPHVLDGVASVVVVSEATIGAERRPNTYRVGHSKGCFFRQIRVGHLRPLFLFQKKQNVNGRSITFLRSNFCYV